MRNLLITTAIATSFAGVAFAQEAAQTGAALSGEVSLDFAENAAGDWAGSMGVELDVTAADIANVNLGFAAAQGGAVQLDTWTVGTDVGGIGIAMGNDNGVFVGAEGEHTIAAPAMTESVKVSALGAEVALGFTNWTSDITDVSNVQAAYSLGLSVAEVKAAVDYNFNTENTVIGAEVGLGNIGVAEVGGTVTYDFDAENIGFEGVAKAYGVTAYVNGDQDDAFQNVGGSYDYALGGATLSAGANYDLNAEEFKPTVGLAFAF